MALQVMVMISFVATIDSMPGAGTTITLNPWASLRLGTPLSVTRTVTLFVTGAGLRGGVQVNTPLDLLMTAPAGAPSSKLKTRTLGGISRSVAEFVNVNSNPANAS